MKRRDFLRGVSQLSLPLIGAAITPSAIAQFHGGSFWKKRSIAGGGSNAPLLVLANRTSGGGALNNSILTSADGVTWAVRSLPSTRIWGRVAWNGSMYCLSSQGTGWQSGFIGYSPNGSNVCETSADGINWVERAMPAGLLWTVAAAGSTFYASGNDPNSFLTYYYYRSTDGINWTAESLPSSYFWNLPVKVGSIYLRNAVYDSSFNPTNVYATSPDGVNWTTRTMPATLSWYQPTSFGSTFLVFGNNSSSTCYAYTSNDGINWTGVALPYPFQTTPVWNGSKLLSVSSSDASLNPTNLACVSSDGINWQGVTMPSSQLWGPVGCFGSRFVVSAYGGVDWSLNYGLYTAGNVFAYSADGVNWTQGTLPASLEWSNMTPGY